jgi:hypothetical protein
MKMQVKMQRIKRMPRLVRMRPDSLRLGDETGDDAVGCRDRLVERDMEREAL